MSHDEDRVFPAFQNLEASLQQNDAFATLHELLGIIEFGLIQADEFDPSASFANDLGSVAALSRAYQGLQAAACLVVLGFYIEARVIIRSTYEAAGLARAIAKDPELAEKWFKKSMWVPDSASRDFAAKGWHEDTPLPHQQYYKQASAFAHPTAVSTVGYIFYVDGEIEPQLYPQFSAELLKVTAGEITALAFFVAYCLRNSLADHDVFPPEWHQHLAKLARDFSGLELKHLDDDWAARQKRHEVLSVIPLPVEQIDEVLDDHPRSVRTLLRRAADTPSSPTRDT